MCERRVLRHLSKGRVSANGMPFAERVFTSKKQVSKNPHFLLERKKSSPLCSRHNSVIPEGCKRAVQTPCFTPFSELSERAKGDRLRANGVRTERGILKSPSLATLRTLPLCSRRNYFAPEGCKRAERTPCFTPFSERSERAKGDRLRANGVRPERGILKTPIPRRKMLRAIKPPLLPSQLLCFGRV